MMDEFNSETDSDYTSYWRDWVRLFHFLGCPRAVRLDSIEALDI